MKRESGTAGKGRYIGDVRDKSAPTGIQGMCLKPIIGGVRDKSAPTGIQGMCLRHSSHALDSS